jgi:flagellar hook-associated protein 3 FlgL
MSVYRVSTANSFDRTVASINERQVKLAQVQDQLSTAKRVNKASDDPVAAVLSERALNRKAQREADLRALDASRRSLEQTDAALAQVADLYARARELVVQAGNAALAAPERRDIAQQLLGIREQLLEVSNRNDTSGNTLFGGLGGAAQPFVDVYDGQGRAVRFDGLRGQEAATAQSLPKMIDGFRVFMGVNQSGNFAASLSADGVAVAQGYGSNLGTGTVTVTGSPTTPGFFSFDENAARQPRYVIEFTQDPPAAPGAQPGEANRVTVTRLDSSGTPPEGVVVVPTTEYPLLVPLPPPAPATAIAVDGMTLSFAEAPIAGDKVELKPADQDVFAVLDRIAKALTYGGSEAPGDRAQDVRRQEIDTALNELDFRLNQSLEARGAVGDFLNRADSLQSLFTDQRDFYEKENSELTDLDMVKGISEFQTQQLTLQAALQAYGQVQRLSLFQYIA